MILQSRNRINMFIHTFESGLSPIIVPRRKLGKADNRHENPCYCMAVS